MTTATCTATTKAGKACRNRATAGDTCRRHIGAAAAPAACLCCGAPAGKDSAYCDPCWAARHCACTDTRCGQVHGADHNSDPAFLAVAVAVPAPVIAAQPEATHSIATRYRVCGHTRQYDMNADLPGAAPSDRMIRILGGVTQTAEGWEHVSAGECEDCQAVTREERARQKAAREAACQHENTRPDYQGWSIYTLCADCGASLGRESVLDDMTPAQAEAVYSAPKAEPACPGHDDRFGDCDCHACFATPGKSGEPVLNSDSSGALITQLKALPQDYDKMAVHIVRRWKARMGGGVPAGRVEDSIRQEYGPSQLPERMYRRVFRRLGFRGYETEVAIGVSCPECDGPVTLEYRGNDYGRCRDCGRIVFPGDLADHTSGPVTAFARSLLRWQTGEDNNADVEAAFDEMLAEVGMAAS